MKVSYNQTQFKMGGKAYNLNRLDELNVNIPDWTVLSETKIQNATDEELKQFVLNFFGEKAKSMFFAVRSSASCEDGVQHSFAGLFESKLNIPFENLPEVIREINKSKESKRVQTYLSNKEIEEDIHVNVIVQELIDADVSGVAFGRHPLKKGSKTKVINAVFGLGEALVNGSVNADTYEIDNGKISGELAEKHQVYFPKKEGGLGIREMSNHDDPKVSLLPKDIDKVVKCLDKLEAFYGEPQDIEFAFKDDVFYLLQSRPITKGKSNNEYIVWDNSNIIESYPGMVSNLTFSFIIKMYAFVYHQFVHFLGASPKTVEKHKSVFDQTLGHVRGRVYYNLLTWYKMLSMVPGYTLNAQYMEQMMGVKEKFHLGEEFRLGKGEARLRIVYMTYKILKAQAGLPKQRKQFLAHLEREMLKYKSIDLDALTLEELITLYKEFETSLLLEWKAPLVNDFFAMIWFGLLKSQCEKLMGESTNIHNDLLCGSQDIISVEPLHESLRISELISNNEAYKSLFVNHTPQEIYSHLSDEKYAQLKQEIDVYIDRFGDRCVGELKLESISYAQDPSLYIKLLKNYAEKEIFSLHHDTDIENELRQKAEQTIAKHLKGPLKKWWFKKVLKKARDLVSNRENLRYERTRAFGMVRRIFLAMGRKLKESGVIENERDIFYLNLEDLLNLKESSDSVEVQNKIKEKREEFNAFAQQKTPEERFFTYGNNFADEYIYSTSKVEDVLQELKGVGCCPGKVKAKVVVVTDPNEIETLDGCILVTNSTDPGWVTLFPSASGILVERGSLLSHSAIVSREMGIPCIVSITGLLRSLKTGDEVIMDGQSGEIKVLKNGAQ